MIEYNPDVEMSFIECFEEHSKVMYLICKRFSRKYLIKNKGLELGDLIGQAKIGFIKAYENYSASKNKKFTTYMGKTVTGYLKNLYFLMDGSGLHYTDHIKKNDIYKEEKISNNERLVFLDAKSHLISEGTNHDVIGFNTDYGHIDCQELLSLLNEEQKFIVYLLLQEEKTGAEIGSILGVSRQTGNMKIKKIQQIISDHYQQTENIDLYKIYMGRTNAGKTFKATDDQGNVYYGDNFKEFAKQRNLYTSEIRKAMKEKRKYKGWKFEFIM